MCRPELDTSKYPTNLREVVAAAAARKWCYVTLDGRSFFVSEKQAMRMQADGGGTVYPPKNS